MSGSLGPMQREAKSPGEFFDPVERKNDPAFINLPDEVWTTVLESQCRFTSDIFLTVMLNLVKNPNISSTFLFRADIFYDSDNHTPTSDKEDFTKHLKPEYRPIYHPIPGFELSRTIVRQLIPRNPQRDAPLIQTCHFYEQREAHHERTLVLYIPHVECVDDIPFYHPSVAKLAFEHINTNDSLAENGTNSISVSYSLFTDACLTTKLERTALRLLQIVHKHGQGQIEGYEKRVNLDQIIPQKRYQDTYTRLKAKYGKQLSETWVEVTDPGKHVFEDIGIAAYLIELWRDMYRDPATESDERGKPAPFPGFVDIGCGNGVLVYILLGEGYAGEGFDARERKTWSIFPRHVQQRLKRRLLVPEIFHTENEDGEGQYERHCGVFPAKTFIISNHADELTTWTPLLAFLNESPFIAIPCCSHDLSGARFRAPVSTKSTRLSTTRLPQQASTVPGSVGKQSDTLNKQAAETGSLKRTEAQKKMPSAYSSLCSYVASLAEDLGFVAEKDVLRIPSTRNHCIIGRTRRRDCEGRVGDKQKVIDLIEQELATSIHQAGAEWMSRAARLAKKPGSGH